MKTEHPSRYPKGCYLNLLPISEDEVVVTVVDEEGEILWRGNQNDFAAILRDSFRHLANKVN